MRNIHTFQKMQEFHKRSKNIKKPVNPGGWSWSVDSIIDYFAGKVMDSLVDGFNDARTHGHTADPGSKLMLTALH